MGSQTKYAKKELVYVTIGIGEPQGDPPAPVETLRYGFFTNIPTANRSALGQIAIPESSYANPPQNLVIGASFPKPRRASRREAQRFVSSFVAKDKIDDAKKAGYRVTPSKARSRIILTPTSFVKSVYVTLRGIKYGWNIPKVTETNAGSLGGLGIVNAVADDRDELCFGANFPKPPRASRVIGSTTEIKVVSTFYDPSKETLPSGWTPIGGAKLNL